MMTSTLSVAIEVAHARADLGGGHLALHLRGINEHVHRLVTAAQNVQDVLQGGAARRGDKADTARQRGDRPLARLVEEAFGG